MPQHITNCKNKLQHIIKIIQYYKMIQIITKYHTQSQHLQVLAEVGILRFLTELDAGYPRLVYAHKYDECFGKVGLKFDHDFY